MLENIQCANEQNHWQELDWKHTKPFIMQWHVHSDDIDHYKHANNVAYIRQLEKLAWAHSNALGLRFEDYETLDRAMVIQHHNLYYHAPSFKDETIACATWISKCDKRFRLQREFQFISVHSQKTVFSGLTDFVCVKLSSGAPKPMPQSFIDIYGAHAINET
ncbi:acyl-CoA thioesterase [Glaciecola siphonariae]|uniref:Acyl-CoA thioesterase n=1 Tax=Glaciecola siphonariae TaxID=521012 RepID=A0ABV9LTC2_9ALTE